MHIVAHFLSLFSADATASYLRNKISHLALEHQKARTKIANARRRFEETREYAVSDFEDKKKATLEATHNAVAQMQIDADEEDRLIDQDYFDAKDKVVVKRKVCDDLARTCQAIGGTDFPLE